jgi:hypothetical protein
MSASQSSYLQLQLLCLLESMTAAHCCKSPASALRLFTSSPDSDLIDKNYTLVPYSHSATQDIWSHLLSCHRHLSSYLLIRRPIPPLGIVPTSS